LGRLSRSPGRRGKRRRRRRQLPKRRGLRRRLLRRRRKRGRIKQSLRMSEGFQLIAVEGGTKGRFLVGMFLC
jgi:hypothetical protein